MASYANLRAEMARFRITNRDIANLIGRGEKAVGYKIKGTHPFTYEEASLIHRKLFPKIPIEKLFETAENTA
jgi:hypothetical protein